MWPPASKMQVGKTVVSSTSGSEMNQNDKVNDL